MEDLVHHLAGGHEFFQNLHLGGVQVGQIRGKFRRNVAGKPVVEIRNHRQVSLRGPATGSGSELDGKIFTHANFLFLAATGNHDHQGQGHDDQGFYGRSEWVHGRLLGG